MIDLEAIANISSSNAAKRKPQIKVDAIIVDANNLLYRLGHVHNHNVGQLVVAFVEKLIMLRDWYGRSDANDGTDARRIYTKLHVVWEETTSGQDRNWRLDIMPSYKSGRDGDSELRIAVRRAEIVLRTLLKYTQFIQNSPVNAEGDDGFGVLAARYRFEGRSCGIYSSDRDLLQLASFLVSLIVPQRGKQDVIHTPKTVSEKLGHGLTPSQIPDIKGLMGDPGDAIPGVPGIGPKISRELIAKHGSLEAVLSAAKLITQNDGETQTAYKARVRSEMGCTLHKLEQIKAHEQQARDSKLVAQIKTDIDIKTATREIDKVGLRALILSLPNHEYLMSRFESFAL